MDPHYPRLAALQLPEIKKFRPANMPVSYYRASLDTQVDRALHKCQLGSGALHPMETYKLARAHSPRVSTPVMKGIIRYFYPSWRRVLLREEGPEDGRSSRQTIEYTVRPLETRFRVLPEVQDHRSSSPPLPTGMEE